MTIDDARKKVANHANDIDDIHPELAEAMRLLLQTVHRQRDELLDLHRRRQEERGER